MLTHLNAPISVVMYYDSSRNLVRPIKIFYSGREYPVTKIGLHHHYRQGRTLYHVFSVVAGGNFFRLVFNTDNLFWRVEEISDGNPN